MLRSVDNERLFLSSWLGFVVIVKHPVQFNNETGKQVHRRGNRLALPRF